MASTAAAQAPLSPPPPTAAMASLALASPVPSAPGAPASAGQVQAHQPHGNNLHSIVEAAAASLAMSPPDGYTTHEEDAGMVSSTGEEQDMPDHRTRQHDPESDENEERREIGGGMLREVAIKSGYLLKKGERRKNWKKRYFVLRPDRLCYYKDDREYQVLRHISVADVHACAQIEVKKHDNSFGIVTARRTYYVRADTRKDADEWVLKINRARKEQDARVRAEQEAQAGQQQQQHLAVAGGADNGAEGEDTTPLGTHAAPSPANASVADLPNEPGQSLQAGAMPIPIRSGSNANTGAAPAGIVSPASDSGAFLSTSAGSSHSQGLPARNGVQIPGSGTSMGSSTSASNNANLGYLSSSWASSSSEQYPSSSDRLASAGLPDTSFSRASTVRGGYTGHGQAVPGAVANTSSAGSRAPVTVMGWPGTGGLVDAEGGLVDDPRSGTSRPQLPAHQRTLSAQNGAGSGMLSSSDEEGDVPLSPGGQLEANQFYSPGLSERDAPLSGQGPATHVQPSSPQQQQQHAKKPSFVGANPHRVVLAGYLMKQGSKRKTWRKRWFTLYGDKLVYTRSHMDRKVHREIRLDSILDALECSPKASRTLHFPKMPGVPLSPGGNSQSFASTSGAGAAGGSSAGGLEASPQPSLPHGSAFSEAEDGGGSAREATQSNCFKIVTPSRGYVVCAPSEEEEIKWLSALRVLIDALRLEKHPETAEA